MSKKTIKRGLVLLLAGLLSWVWSSASNLLNLHWMIDSSESVLTLGYNWHIIPDFIELLFALWTIASIIVTFAAFAMILIGTRQLNN